MEESSTNPAFCQLKRGFFVLRPCRRRAAARCSECQRAICNRHGERVDQAIFCSDCYARRSDAFSGSDFYNRDSWRHGYRSGFYSSAVYTPIALSGGGSDDSFAGGGGEFGGGGASGGWDEGTGGAPDFDDSDVAAFDADGQAGFDDDGDGGLFDS